MAMPPAKKLRKEQQKQQSKARKEAETPKEAAQSNPEDLQCSKCNRRFKKGTKCAIHVAWCTNDHKCAQCPNDTTKYPTDRALHRHCTFLHNPLGCSFCQAKPAEQSREEHERECHPKEFEAREYKRRHHPELQQCSFCRVKLFPQEKEQHERDSHPGEFDARGYRPNRYHERQRCRFCKAKCFPEEIKDHEREAHPREFRAHDYQRQHPRERRPPSSSEQKTSQEVTSPPEAPGHYKTLGVARNASAEEIEQAAKKMRILSHPDKLKRSESTPEELIGIDERAKNVGWAADILCNEESRRKYDRELDGFFY